MHDCQRCQTPLHGHESFCPICGLKQYVRPENEPSAGEQYKRGYNPMFLVLLALLVGALLFYAVQNSWVGQLMKRGPIVEVEDNAATQEAAREKLENAIIQNLSGQSSTPKFTYMSGDKAVDRNYPQPVELTIDVRLKDPSKRHSIIDPVKALMVPAHINILTLNEGRSGATVTYSVAGGGASNPDDTSSGSTKSADDGSQGTTDSSSGDSQ